MVIYKNFEKFQDTFKNFEKNYQKNKVFIILGEVIILGNLGEDEDGAT